MGSTKLHQTDVLGIEHLVGRYALLLMTKKEVDLAAQGVDGDIEIGDLGVDISLPIGELDEGSHVAFEG